MPHLHEAIDCTVAAYIIHKNTVLMISHKQLQKWLPIGGHIELDEDPDQALFREITEEAGLDQSHLKILNPKPQFESEGTKFLYTPSFLDIHHISPTHRHVGMIHFLISDTNQVTLAGREHSDIKWLSRNDLRKTEYNLSPAIKFYATQALNRAREYSSH